jgi:putative aldouronate transport system substrate-binding protein
MKAGKIFSYFQAGKPGLAGQVKAQTGLDVYTSCVTPAKSFTSAVNNFMWGVPNYSKNGEKAVAFLNLMYSDTNVENLFVWGIEGKHYAKTGDGHIDYPQGVDAKTNGYGLGMGFAFGNQLTANIWKGDPIDLYKQLDNFNKSSVKSQAYGFMFDQSNVKTEMTALTNVTNQYRQVVGQGTVDSTKLLPEFQAKLKEAGIDKVIAEKHLNNAPKLKALLDKNPEAMKEYVDIIGKVRYDATSNE